jgi:TetR/AcrR family transcriptional regulator, regulator of autoinduction and epiphytic fitness
VQDSALPTDGRAARAVRTRDAIVEATVALVEEGDLRPTAPRIAERAGVSVRSVFQHFDDLSSLYTAVVQRVVERLAVLLVPIDPAQPLPERMATFARNRANLLEAVTPFRRAAAVHGPFAPEIRHAAGKGTLFLRLEVETVFAPEIAAVDEGDRRELTGALAAAASWPVWESLRSEAGYSSAQAQGVLRRMLRSLLAGSGR